MTSLKKKFFGLYVFYKFENETKEGSLKMFDFKMITKYFYYNIYLFLQSLILLITTKILE